ncbi:MAG: Do family serine endopeptidase [Alphaproteobacteria bacterium]|nr:Do family serine endopeptidase [Alphaproteobacteria bacterium]
MKLRLLILPTLLALALIAPGVAWAKRILPTTTTEMQLSFAGVVRRVAPAVVNVYARSVVRQQVNPLFADPLFQQFFGLSPQFRRRVQQSLGSGVIVRSDGVILTNDHVIAGAQDIVVALSDRREFKAKVLLADKRTDLAVLKINVPRGERLPTIAFGNSDRLQVGDIVLAIGDPFGVGQTVTQGIVSALARTNVADGSYRFFIQTDAAINPGNSGGALVTTDGKLAGINTAIYSRSGGNIGIGFAIPANLARRVVDGALGGGVQLPWFGAAGQSVTPKLASALGLKLPEGVVLNQVYPGGPAAKAGLKRGDVVLAIDGADVNSMDALNYRVATHKPGEIASVRAVTNGHVHAVSVRLDLPPQNPPPDKVVIGGQNPLTGAHVENLSPAVATQLQLDPMLRGVVVASPGQGLAANQGFETGDIIQSINGQAIRNVGQLRQALLAGERQGGWEIVVNRNGQQLSLAVRR